MEKLRPTDVLFDIGAFYGAFGAAAKAALGDAIQVHSFEPVAGNLSRIMEIYERNRLGGVKIINKAVGSGAAISGAVDALDGMLRQRPSNLTSETQAHSDDPVSFPTTTIDEYRRETGASPTVLKIDVEGFEADVLEGARETLRDVGPRIWLELHPSFLSERGRTWEAIVASLEATGYSVSFFEDAGYTATKEIAFHVWCERGRGGIQAT